MLVYSFLMFHLISSLMSGPKHRTVNRSCSVSKYKSFFLTPSSGPARYTTFYFHLKIKKKQQQSSLVLTSHPQHIYVEIVLLYTMPESSHRVRLHLHVFNTKAAKLNYISTLFLMETLFRLINGFYLHEGDLIWETRR